MASIGRKLGVNIFALMQKENISREDLAQKLGYSYRDICRLTEGRLLLPPVELNKIAQGLNVTKNQLLHGEAADSIPELQYLKAFSNTERLNEILDLLDDYVELKESV